MKALRWLRASLAGVLLALPALVAAAATTRFDIPAGEANRTITRFAQQAGIPVLFDFELVEGRRTRTVRGTFETRAALRRLLEDSGLVASTNGRGQITIRAAPSASARAGTVSGPDGPSGGREAGAEDTLPEIAVTGTRLGREGLTLPSPVAAITSVELQSMGPTTLVDALVQLPHFLNNDTPATQSFGTSGAAGASHLNLRGIGSIRTLTLLDGRRVAPSTRFGTVDIALFPRNLVRRVEVVTGGASAAYGSDAVSGVVNMIIDTDFRGLRVQAQTGVSERGDHGNSEFALTMGSRVGEQSSLVFAAEAFEAQGIRGYARRDWFDSWAAITDPDAGPGAPGEIISRGVRATGYTYGGLITSGPLAGTQFLPGGVSAPFRRGALSGPVTQAGGDGVDPAADVVWILPDQKRLSAFARFATQPTAAFSAFAQLHAGHTENFFEKDAPSLWGAWEATVFDDNAFLPADVRARMAAAGVSSFRMGRMAADGELGRGAVTLDGDLLSATVGAAWHLDDWTIEGYYQDGRNETALAVADTLRIDRIYRGIDSVVDPSSGAIVCRSTLSFPDDGCVPVNLFGQGSISPQARAWVTEGRSTQTQQVQERVAEITLKGDLPWFAGHGVVSVATGLNWRSEWVRSTPRRFPESLEGLRVEPAASQGYRGLPASYANTPSIFERVGANSVRGGYRVWEAFAEAVFPLLERRRGAHRLDLHAALRQARYSGSGDIPAWKLGVDWQLTPSLRLRATQSRDVRAGSLSERYDVGVSGTTITDVQSPGNAVYAVISQRTGNPSIDPEEGDTRTAGFVLQPARLPGFSVAADYYDIRVRDAIATYGTQAIITGCATGEALFCELIERNPDSGLITRVRNLVLNSEEARSRGVDVEVALRRPVQWLGGGESMALRLFANHTLESSTTSAAGVRIDRAGQTGLFGGAPRWQANLSVAYERGGWLATLQQRVTGSGIYTASPTAAVVDEPRIRSAATTNLRLAWSPGQWTGLNAWVTVQNLFDEDPPRAPDWGFMGSMPTNEGLFDVLGRRFSVGLRYER